MITTVDRRTLTWLLSLFFFNWLGFFVAHPLYKRWDNRARTKDPSGYAAANFVHGLKRERGSQSAWVIFLGVLLIGPILGGLGVVAAGVYMMVMAA